MDRPACYGQEQIEAALLQVLVDKESLKRFYKALEVFENITCSECGDYDPSQRCPCWNDE